MILVFFEITIKPIFMVSFSNIVAQAYGGGCPP